MSVHCIDEQPHFSLSFASGGVVVTYIHSHNDPEDPEDRGFNYRTMVLTSWGDEAKRLMDHSAGEFFCAMHKWDARDAGSPVVPEEDELPIRTGVDGDVASRVKRPRKTRRAQSDDAGV